MKLNYLKLITLITLLPVNINKWNLKVLISDLLFFVFQFHIPLAPLWVWKHKAFSLLRRLKTFSKFIFWKTGFVRTFRNKNLKCENFLVRKSWSTWCKICSCSTQLSLLIHQLLTLHSTTLSRTSLFAAFIVGPLVLPRK